MSLRDKIVGTWELVEYYREDSDGEKNYPLSKDASGFLMYTADGYMSAHLMKEGRSNYTEEGLHNGTTEEMAEAAHGYHAYAGKYEIDEEDGTVYHHNTVSLIPDRIGAVQDRQAQFDGDQMTITSRTSTTHVTWKKAPYNPGIYSGQ